MNSRRMFLASATAGLAGSVAPSLLLAQTYPNRPIKIVMPGPAAGVTDALARLIAEKLSSRLGQPVIVDNKPGASGILGAQYVAKAAPDGYTLLYGIASFMAIPQFLYDKFPIDYQKDFILLCMIATVPNLLTVKSEFPANNVPELLKYLSTNPGKLTYGSWGNGTYPHMAGAYMSQSQNAGMVHVPYKGEAPMILDLLAGQISMAYDNVSVAKPHIEAGKLKALAINGVQRVAAMPNVPTFAEQGLNDEPYQVRAWHAMAAPAGTPKAIVERLSEEIRFACQQPDVAARFTGSGMEVKVSTPEEAAAFYAAELPVWKRLVKLSGARAE